MKLKGYLNNILLIAIFVFSLFIYTYNINSYPPSLFSDEVDVSYQAYIFNKNHSDYYNNKYPIHFHSFSDWRTSLYIYSVVASQKIFGHTDFSVRFPAAIFGSISVLIFYLIVFSLNKNSSVSLVSTFIYSISPWLFQYSRTGFEVTGMLLFILLGILFLIKFLQESKDINIYWSILFFSLSIYFYSTAKLFIILIFFTTLFLWSKKIFSISIKTKIISFLLIVVLLTPFCIDTLRGRSGYRFSYISIFTEPTISKTNDYYRQLDSVQIYGEKVGIKASLESKIFHNKIVSYSNLFLQNYLSSFSTNFLLVKGDSNLRHGIQTHGYFYLLDLFLFFIGISVLFKSKTANYKFYKFIIILLLLSPIPFSLTRDSVSPHATRLILMLPFVLMFASFGIEKISENIKNKYYLGLILFTYLLFFANFIHQYRFHYPNISAREWHYGMKNVVIESLKYPENIIFFSDSNEPFMPFFLNYSEFIPDKFQINSTFLPENNTYFNGVKSKNIYIGKIEWNDLFNSKLIDTNIFAINSKDIDRINKEMLDYNSKHEEKIKIKQLYRSEQKYIEQDTFYLISFYYSK